MRSQHLFLMLFVIVSLFSCAGNEKTEHEFLIGFSQCTMGDDWRKTMIVEMRREMDLFRDPGIEFVVKDAGDSNEQ